MTSIDEARVREILDGCEGTTSGPWSVFDHGRLLVIAPEAGWSVFEICDPHPTERPTHEKNAAHIARCDPDTVRVLCTLALERLASKQAVVSDEALFHALALAYGAGWDDRYCHAPRNTGRRHLERYAKIAINSALAAPVRDEPKRIEVDIGAAVSALQASPELAAMMNEALGVPDEAAIRAAALEEAAKVAQDCPGIKKPEHSNVDPFWQGVAATKVEIMKAIRALSKPEGETP